MLHQFEGRRRADVRTTTVYYGGRPLPLHLDVRNHSPTGFEWGYAGSGPAQLALAMLLAVTTRVSALSRYQEFKDACISRINADHWTIRGEDVLRWLDRGTTVPVHWQ